MKTILSISLSLLLIISSIATSAQSFKVHGNIVDEGKKQGLEFASVSLIRLPDSGSVSTQISDKQGAYTFSTVAPGKYIIGAQFIGHITARSGVLEITDADVVVPDIVLLRGSGNLKAVTVLANRPLIERKVDRMVFNVENSIAARGTDLTEALALTPMLRVSDNGVSIVGKGGVSVMINERIVNIGGVDLVNYLKSLRSDDVAKIEVITTPPAKYDAQGSSGMINIVLKKNPTLGWSGSASSAYLQGFYASYSNNFNLNYQSRKLSSSLRLRQYDRKSMITEELNTISANSILGNDERKSMSYGLGVNLSVDYKISKKVSAGFIYDIGDAHYDIDVHNSTAYQTASHTDSVLNTFARHKNPAKTHTLSVYADYKLDSMGQKLSTGFNYFSNVPQTTIDFQTQSDHAANLAVARSFSGIRYAIWSAQADLTLHYHEAIVETGAKFTNFDNNSEIAYYDAEQQVYTKDPGKSNLFEYNEKNLAGYVSAQQDFTKKWSAKAGLRYEYSIIRGYSPTVGMHSKNSYGKLFPTAYLSYKANDNNTFSLAYSRRIGRPNFRAINPARYYSNSYTYFMGNPLLQPSYNHNIDLSYLYKGLLSVSVFAEKTTNGYGTIVDVDNVFRVSHLVNYLTQYNAGLVVTLNLKLFPWWETSSYATFSVSDSKSAIPQITTSNGHGFSYSTNNTFAVSKKATLLLNFSHSLPSTRGNLYNASYYTLSPGCRLLLANKKLQINASVYDVLRSEFNKSEIYYKDFTYYDNVYYDYRRLNLSVTYIFGKSKVKGNQKQVNFKETQRAN